MKRTLLLSLALCAGVLLSAQAASAQGTLSPLSGRVTTQDGRGIGRVKVTAHPLGYCFEDTDHTATTNPLGYYYFPAIHTDCQQLMTLQHKAYSFEPRLINFGDSFENQDFVANEQYRAARFGEESWLNFNALKADSALILPQSR